MKALRVRVSRVAGPGVLALLLALAVGLSLVGSDTASAATTNVNVGQKANLSAGDEFNANSSTITTGDTVHWAWFAGTHNITSFNQTGGVANWGTAITFFDGAGKTFDRTFSTAGTEWYFCSLHGARGDIDTNGDGIPGGPGDTPNFGKMIGKITINAPAPDTTPPTTSAVAAAPNPTNGAGSVTLTATIADSGTPLGTIASAQYRIDAGIPVSMSASDGAFNSATENVTANVPVGGLTAAVHTVEVLGTDNAGNASAWVALAGGLNVTTPPAGAVQATVSVDGGNLTNTPPATIAFGNVTLSGADQTVAAVPGTWEAKDARGTGAGWNVTVASTDFSGAGVIPVANFKMRQLQAGIVTVSGNTAPTSLVTTFQSLGGTPLKVLSAALNTGKGTYDYTPDFQLTVPSSTSIGTYSANVTVSVNSGP